MKILFMNAIKLWVAQMHHVVCAFYRLAAIAAKLFKHHGHLVAFIILGHKRVWPFGIVNIKFIGTL